MRCSLGPDTRMDGFCRASRQVGRLRGGGGDDPRGGGGALGVESVPTAKRSHGAESLYGQSVHFEAKKRGFGQL